MFVSSRRHREMQARMRGQIERLERQVDRAESLVAQNIDRVDKLLRELGAQARGHEEMLIRVVETALARRELALDAGDAGVTVVRRRRSEESEAPPEGAIDGAAAARVFRRLHGGGLSEQEACLELARREEARLEALERANEAADMADEAGAEY